MLRSLAQRLVPQAVSNWREAREFHSLPRLTFDTINLRCASDIRSDTIFDNAESDRAWQDALPQLSRFEVPDGITSGVNPGDRRAVFYLVMRFRPQKLLEIGTHIGASMVHIATALARIGKSASPATMISVDIEDVNDPNQKLWLKYGAPRSPRDSATLLGVDNLVQFVTSPSLDYMSACRQKFDVIFLDGDHTNKTVYPEVAAALKLLNPGGVILLHDYFPEMQPLWSNNVVIRGPFEAIERSRREGAAVKALPLGALPWPTKCGSNVTSLALLTRDC
jgi:predicted O-methyltransferase YrrM